MALGIKGISMKLLLLTCAATALTVSNASASTITFDGSQQGTLTSFSQNGFTVTAVSGDVNTGVGTGNPPPSLFGYTSGSFAVTGAGLFSFAGFDGGSGALSAQTQTFTYTGFNGAAQAFTATVTRNGSGGFNTYASTSSNLIDRLVFSLSATNGTSFNVDNIVVNAAVTPAVPEPATWAMMLVGFGMVGGASRFRRRSVKVSLA